jgi:hypothetical protein
MRQKKSLLFLLIFSLFFCFSMVSHGWQGRMAGMEDSYGLVADESDYLIHVAKIAEGKGLNFYGGYRFTYTEIEKYRIKFTEDGDSISSDFPGDILGHSALLGSSFALGAGRLGVFFAYDNSRGDFKFKDVTEIRLREDLDNFALRVMYGIPVGGFNFGAEAGVAYREEKNGSLWSDGSASAYNSIGLIEYSEANFFLPPFIPYNTSYWEIPLKAGLSGKMGHVDTQFTLRGGIIVAGDNKLTFTMVAPPNFGSDDLDGDAKGWSAGADLWLRYNLSNGLSLPFVVRADYLSKKRDGRGILLNLEPDIFIDYKNKETVLDVTLGGGMEKAFGQNTRLAGGIYYSYLDSKKDLILRIYDEGIWEFDYFFDDFPSSVEHRTTLRLAGEHAISPVVTLRGGLSFFYGFVKQDTVFGGRDPGGEVKIKFAADGYRGGAGASIGASVKLAPVTLEPFLNAGYQYMKLTADAYENGVFYPDVERKDKREQWYVGGGLAVRFGQ